LPAGLQISYQSNSCAMAVVSPRPGKIEIDGAEYREKLIDSGSNFVLVLPRGQHIVELGSSATRILADDR